MNRMHARYPNCNATRKVPLAHNGQPMSTAPGTVHRSSLDELERRKALALGAARQDRIERQHERGQLTAHERIELLLDAGSFRQMGRFVFGEDLADIDRTIGGDGSVFGFGTIEDRPVAVETTDPTVKGSSHGDAGTRVGRTQARILQKCRLPLFELRQGGGARITEMISSKFAGVGGHSMGDRYVFGPKHVILEAWLGDYFGPQTIADYIVTTRSAHASITSPALLEVATGQRHSADELGGSEVHARVTGQVDGVAEDEGAAIAQLRKVFSYYPSYPGGAAPRRLGDDSANRLVPELRTILPENPNRAFDIRKVLNLVLDKGSFIEFSPDFARNLVTGLGRMDGWPVGIVANQSMAVAGTIDTAAMIKARRMLAIAHLYSIPFLSFLDTPGVLTTLEQEHSRLISEIYALAASRLRPAVPKVAVIVRKGIGFAYPMMTASDPESLTFAWPSARIAFTGPEPAARIVYGREIQAADDPTALLGERAEEMRALSTPRLAAELGHVDAIIDPAETRKIVIRSLDALRSQNLPRRRSLMFTT
jgi:acetyl-CoA carboxylase carboxyltransferase component